MSIGIIGINQYAEYLNWACPVHCFAFQQFLLSKGIDCKVLDYYPSNVKDFDFDDPAGSYAKRLINAINRINKHIKNPIDVETIRNLIDNREEIPTSMFEKIEYINREDGYAALVKVKKSLNAYNGMRELTEEFASRLKKFRGFARENIIYTDEKYNYENIEYKDPGFDIYITPTDVLWRLLNGKFERAYMLNTPVFDGKGKIAFSVSRGVFNGYKKQQEEWFRTAVEDYDYVSVREPDLYHYVSENTNATSSLTIDPVLLHSKEFWQKIAVKPKEEKYVLLYYVMEKSEDTINMAIEYAKKHNLQIVELSDRPIKGGSAKDEKINQISKYDISPQEWLGYIENADYIFTNSFHGCCFSILFNKLFMPGKRGVIKVRNLMRTLHVPENTKYEKIGKYKVPKSINWKPIEEELKIKTKESEEYILNAIEQLQEGKKNKMQGEQKAIMKGTIKYINSIKNKDEKKEIYEENREFINDGKFELMQNPFKVEGKRFAGWNINVKWKGKWYSYMKNGTLDLKKNRRKAFGLVTFQESALVPYLAVDNIQFTRKDKLLNMLFGKRRSSEQDKLEVAVEAVWK